MSPAESLQFLAQAAQDLSATLPPSVRAPFLGAAQHHITVLEQALTPAVAPEAPASEADAD